MVEATTVSEMSRLSIQLAGVFTVVGIGLMYLYIAISDASTETKILWASALSLAVAFTFLIIWTIARDYVRQLEQIKRRGA